MAGDHPQYPQRGVLDGMPVVVEAERDSGTWLSTDEGTFRGVQYRVQMPDGTRKWTVTFPNYDRPKQEA